MKFEVVSGELVVGDHILSVQVGKWFVTTVEQDGKIVEVMTAHHKYTGNTIETETHKRIVVKNGENLVVLDRLDIEFGSNVNDEEMNSPIRVLDRGFVCRSGCGEFCAFLTFNSHAMIQSIRIVL